MIDVPQRIKTLQDDPGRYQRLLVAAKAIEANKQAKNASAASIKKFFDNPKSAQTLMLALPENLDQSLQDQQIDDCKAGDPEACTGLMGRMAAIQETCANTLVEQYSGNRVFCDCDALVCVAGEPPPPPKTEVPIPASILVGAAAIGAYFFFRR